MDKGKVSIIIPVYNSSGCLRETFNSILAQTYTDWECICVDDGSTDTSLDIIKGWIGKDRRFHLYLRPDSFPKGGNTCRNLGFEKATGEYIQWFDSDDLMHEDMIRCKVKALEERDTSNYVICRTAYFSSDPIHLTPYDQHLDTDNIVLDYLTFKTKFFTPGPMFRKSFLDKMNLFDIDLKRHQEKEFFFRVILKDKNYLLIDKPLVWRRMHDSSLSVSVNNSSTKLLLEFEANNKMFNHYIAHGQSDKSVISYFRRFFLRYAYFLLKQRRYSTSMQSIWNFLRSACNHV